MHLGELIFMLYILFILSLMALAQFHWFIVGISISKRLKTSRNQGRALDTHTNNCIRKVSHKSLNVWIVHHKY